MGALFLVNFCLFAFILLLETANERKLDVGQTHLISVSFLYTFRNKEATPSPNYPKLKRNAQHYRPEGPPFHLISYHQATLSLSLHTRVNASQPILLYVGIEPALHRSEIWHSSHRTTREKLCRISKNTFLVQAN